MRSVIGLAILLTACTTPDNAPQAAFPAGQLIDLTHVYNAETPFWPTADGFELDVDFAGMTDGGYWYEANTFRTAEHGGTHLDAPVHFAEGKHSTDQIPLERLVAPAVMIDVSEAALADADYQIAPSDLQAWEAEHGEIPDGHILLFRTGYAQFWPDRVSYMGTDERGPDAVAKLHFPGIHPDAAQWLVDNRSVAAVGLDTPSIDFGQSSDFLSHRILFEANIPAFENVAEMAALPATGFSIIALPMHIEAGSGGPLRIVAVVP
ncbi:MAG: cyclase family protein [Rhodothermales bacterium]|nr:cyclase family protein [Rhodothermales bacterium]MBO6778414.1 cyclase family protein [Rhodothermales bacterium]